MLQPYDTTMNTVTAVIPANASAPAIKRAIGEMANRVARMNTFKKYKKGAAESTLRHQLNDLECFASYLRGLTETLASEPEFQNLDAWQDITGQDLYNKPTAWQGITHGLVEGFFDWMGNQGYAIGTMNGRLSAVKRYAELAYAAGVLSQEDYALIKLVKGHKRKEARRIDAEREKENIPTRKSAKKADPVRFSVEQACQLKDHDLTTPQGRRDAVIMCILIDHGLRVGELAALKVKDVDFEASELAFYRQKVDKAQRHTLSPDTLAALIAWRDSGDMPLANDAPLLRSSRKGGHLTSAGMTERAIAKRVRALGEAIGIERLSPHDCRHFWATNAARNGTSPFRLQEAGGWNSLAMPRRYIEEATIANQDWQYGDTQISGRKTPRSTT